MSKKLIESGVFSFVAQGDYQLTVWKEEKERSSAQAGLATAPNAFPKPSRPQSTPRSSQSLTASPVSQNHSSATIALREYVRRVLEGSLNGLSECIKVRLVVV